MRIGSYEMHFVLLAIDIVGIVNRIDFVKECLLGFSVIFGDG